MHAHACTLPCRIQAWNFRLTPLIGPHASHLVVGPRTHRDGTLNWIDTGKFHGEFANLREPFHDALTPEVTKIQQHASIHPTTLEDFLPDRKRHGRAGGQFHLLWSVVLHEALAQRV